MTGARPDILDNAFVIVDFANGVRACSTCACSPRARGWQEEIAATGDRARIEALIPGPARFSAGRAASAPAEIVVSPRAHERPERGEEVHVDEAMSLKAGDHHGSTYFQHRKFFDMVRDGGRPEVTLEDGLMAVAIGAAAERSARTGEAVDLRGTT
jgi:myo-inositol 2-dehydrogenase/D-chiro-inositol 1-dehydrogenase